MKRLYLWMLAAILICGASVFTSCDSNDNPVQPVPEQSQAEKNRDKFIEHTRATVKEMAENLNFGSWQAANNFNLYFNQYVLANKEFDSPVILTILHMMTQNIHDVEAGSELAAQGYKRYIDLNLSDFKYRFTMREGKTDFDWEKADALEFILNGYNPITKQVEDGIYKVTLKMDGTSAKKVVPAKNTDGGAFVLTLPSELQFALSSKVSGAWHDDFSGVIRYQLPEGATDASKGYTAEAKINSDILPEGNNKGDKTQLDLSISSDRVNGHATVLGSWVQNDRKMLELSLKESGEDMGGISTLEDKSLGCTQKSGSSPVAGVLSYGDRIPAGGLWLLEGPGNDMVACTNLAAAGCVMILFTTGRGTPLGAPVPTVKIASNAALASVSADTSSSTSVPLRCRSTRRRSPHARAISSAPAALITIGLMDVSRRDRLPGPASGRRPAVPTRRA